MRAMARRRSALYVTFRRSGIWTLLEVKPTSGEAVGYAGLTRTAIDGPILPWFTARVGCARGLRLDRDDTLDLDRDLVWQHDVADRGAGMPSGFAEHFDKSGQVPSIALPHPWGSPFGLSRDEAQFSR